MSFRKRKNTSATAEATMTPARTTNTISMCVTEILDSLVKHAEEKLQGSASQNESVIYMKGALRRKCERARNRKQEMKALTQIVRQCLRWDSSEVARGMLFILHHVPGRTMRLERLYQLLGAERAYEIVQKGDASFSLAT